MYPLVERCLSVPQVRDVRAVNTPAGHILIFHNTIRIHSRLYRGICLSTFPRENRYRRSRENPRSPHRSLNSVGSAQEVRQTPPKGEETCCVSLP